MRYRKFHQKAQEKLVQVHPHPYRFSFRINKELVVTEKC
jgi:hypothetical protein